MKTLISALIILNFSMVFADDDKKPEGQVQIQMTTADAKKKCKDEGKEGKELVECIKEKKGDK